MKYVIKYVKKPVVVEAFQFGIDEIPEWFTCTVELKIKDGVVGYDKDFCLIPIYYRVSEVTSIQRNGIGDYTVYHEDTPTLAGDSIAVHKGDFIIKGIKGEIYPCKEDIFDATYEPFEEEAAK
jgi:hypothetical protein